MTFPTEPVTVPAEVTAIAAGRPVRAVWVNELGGVTFSVADGAEYVKVYPDEHAGLLVAEAQRLTWARRYVTVPEVLNSGPGWLHTAGLPARSAVDRRWTDQPRIAAHAIGVGLRHLHDGCRSRTVRSVARRGCPPTHRLPTGSSCAMAMPARRTP